MHDHGRKGLLVPLHARDMDASRQHLWRWRLRRAFDWHWRLFSEGWWGSLLVDALRRLPRTSCESSARERCAFVLPSGRTHCRLPYFEVCLCEKSLGYPKHSQTKAFIAKTRPSNGFKWGFPWVLVGMFLHLSVVRLAEWFDISILENWAMKSKNLQKIIFHHGSIAICPCFSRTPPSSPLKQKHIFPGAHTALSQWLAKLESAETQQAVWKLLSEFHLSGKVSYLEAAKKRHHYAEVNKLWLQNEVPRGKWWKRYMILYDNYI